MVSSSAQRGTSPAARATAKTKAGGSSSRTTSPPTPWKAPPSTPRKTTLSSPRTATPSSRPLQQERARTTRGLSNGFFLSVFIDVLCVALVAPLTPQYSAYLGVPRAHIGYVQSVYGVMQVVSTSTLSPLSDVWGRRPILLVSVLGTSFAYAVLSLGVFWKSVAFLYVSRIIVGGVRQTMAVGSALVTEAFTDPDEPDEELRKKEVVRGLSRLSAATSFAFVVGPAVGGYAVTVMGLLPATVASAVIGLLNGLLMAAVVPATTPTRRKAATPAPLPAASIVPAAVPTAASGIRAPWETMAIIVRGPRGAGGRSSALLLLAMYFWSAAFVTVQTSSPLLLPDGFGYPVHVAGMIISTTSGLNILAQKTVLPFLLARVSRTDRVAIMCVGVSVAGYALQAASCGHRVPFLIGMVVVALTSGVAHTLFQGTMASLWPAERAGEVMAVVFQLDGINRVVTPILSSHLASGIHPLAPLSLAFAFAVVSCILHVAELRKVKKD